MRRLLGVTAGVTLILVLLDVARTPDRSLPSIGAWTFLARVAARGAVLYGGALLLFLLLAIAIRAIARSLGLASADPGPGAAFHAGAGWSALVLASGLSILGLRAAGLRWPSAPWLFDLEIVSVVTWLGGWGVARLVRDAGGDSKGHLGVALLAIGAMIPPIALGLPVYLRAGVPEIGAIAEAKPGSPDILLIVVDSLRADALSCYGASGPPTPALDRLASEGALFSNASAAAPGATASTTSILTSRLPSENGVAGTLGVLRPGIPTLAGALRARGYETAGIVSSPLLSRTNGLDRGFARWDEDPDPRFAAAHPKVISAEILRSFGWKPRDEAPDARTIVDRALRFLEAPRNAPRFLYLGLMGPNGFKRATLSGILRGEIAMSAEDLRDARGRYGAEVATLDNEVGRLLKGLEGEASTGGFLVVFTADHGEEFMDHGSLGHGHALYEEMLHVPLLIVRKGSVPAGARIETPISQLNVAPTILDLAHLPPESSFSGLSLQPLLNREAHPVRQEPVTSELNVLGYHTTHRWMRSARRGDWKVILTAGDVLGLDGWAREAYNLATDPLERTNLAKIPAEAKELQAWIEERLRRDPPESIPLGVTNPERERRLKALGITE